VPRILMGAFGSAILLVLILGVALIETGLQQWREADFGCWRRRLARGTEGRKRAVALR